MSCEPKRTISYGPRWRMVYQVEMMDKSCREVGKNLCVDPSTVCRTVASYNASGNVDKRKYPPNAGTTILSEVDTIIILATVYDKPKVLLRELRH